jgi:hypothetical protein
MLLPRNWDLRTGHRSPGRLISLQAYRGLAVVSTTSKSWVIVAVLAIIADAEQYFSTDSTMARPTFSGASGLGVGAP